MASDTEFLHIDPLVPWRRAVLLMGLSPSTGERRRKTDPTFPPRVAIGPERWALRASEIRKWNESRPTDREMTFKRPPKKGGHSIERKTAKSGGDSIRPKRSARRGKKGSTASTAGA